ncbi:MAG TPA: DNA-processing protein DprA [Spirillospora sp.]|nr:DNA-processing protein DprA [Spirillospora sp.]
MSDPTLWIALGMVEHIGSRTLWALIRHFGDDPDAILAASAAQLQQVPGVGPKIARGIQAVDLRQVRRALAGWQAAGISIVTSIHPDELYPPRLLSTDDPPATLFMRGAWQPQFDRAVGIVGTRSPSAPAAQLTRELSARLAQAGFVVVSGLARGVDTLAHEGALSVEDGHTIAVLGSGVLNIYPQENHTLAMDIAGRGVIMSEVRPDAAPASTRLVARNRIISGLSRALIVVETDIDGGAMHAARFAQRQGRPVFTFDLKAGGNRALLANGARKLEPDLKTLDFIGDALEKER